MLNLPQPHQRDENINAVYQFFEDAFGTVPKPLQLLSASPGLFNLQNNTIQYFARHESLSFPLLTTIRYITASRLDYTACIEFNSMLLEKQGMDNEEIERLTTKPETAPLEENEVELLRFVVKCLDGNITDKDMQSLIDSGWHQSDILDAVSHSYSMIPLGRMMQLFRFS